MAINNLQKPCVVETPQGFSVSYKERFLYSKYNPSKLIDSTVDQLQIAPGTIFLCNSPALCYGLEKLLEKLPENCLIYLCEFDENLLELTKQSEIYKNLNKDTHYLNRIIFVPTTEELYDLPFSIFEKAKTGTYRRVIRLDFSSGIQFYKNLYDKLYEASVNSIKTFWTNRLTLTKFGRKYSHNFFINLRRVGNTTKIESYIKKITKPIIVIGAGQSADKIYDFFYKNQTYSPNDFFILCVDTILSSLISKNIIPNGVFVEEAQTIITKAFICKKHNIQLFAGLSSVPELYEYFNPKNISYFTTEYTKSTFIEDLRNKMLLPFVNNPFGSVGITAVFYGLQFRSNDKIPVLVTGLDFSYSVGYTHGKGTIAHKEKLINNNKITPIENFNAAFSNSTQKFLDKSGNIFITTPSLKNYSDLFIHLFSNKKNIFDLGESGIELNIPKIREFNLNDFFATNKSDSNNKQIIKKLSFDSEYLDSLNYFFEKEKNDLKELRTLLTKKTNLTQYDLEKEITKKAVGKEYLYLHFPDGYCFNYNQSFLNRIRTEIDFFLKIFD